MFGSEVRFLHCAATVIPKIWVKSDLNTILYPEQERCYAHLSTSAQAGVFYFMKQLSTKIAIIPILLLPLLIVPTSAYAKVKKVEKHKVTTKVAQVKKNEPQIEVSLIATDHTYKFKTKEGSTVFDAMNTLAQDKSSQFTFHYKDYSSLGSFIYEINGTKGIPGHYFLYYVNNKKASVGVSKYVLHSGDVVEWKQESF